MPLRSLNGALAFATAGTLGASLLACLVSAVSAMAIDRVNRRLNRHGLPFFFQYAVGGAIATAPPILLYALSPKLGFQFEPTVAIAAGLVSRSAEALVTCRAARDSCARHAQ